MIGIHNSNIQPEKIEVYSGDESKRFGLHRSCSLLQYLHRSLSSVREFCFAIAIPIYQCKEYTDEAPLALGLSGGLEHMSDSLRVLRLSFSSYDNKLGSMLVFDCLAAMVVFRRLEVLELSFLCCFDDHLDLFMRAHSSTLKQLTLCHAVISVGFHVEDGHFGKLLGLLSSDFACLEQLRLRDIRSDICCKLGLQPVACFSC
jgi:hypothetical protein